MQIAKENFIQDLVSSFGTDSSKLYRHLRDLNNPPTRSVFIGVDSEVLRTPSEIVCAFNNDFNSTFTTSSYTLPAMDKLPAPSVCLNTIHIDLI